MSLPGGMCFPKKSQVAVTLNKHFGTLCFAADDSFIPDRAGLPTAHVRWPPGLQLVLDACGGMLCSRSPRQHLLAGYFVSPAQSTICFPDREHRIIHTLLTRPLHGGRQLSLRHANSPRGSPGHSPSLRRSARQGRESAACARSKTEGKGRRGFCFTFR